jgi:excalibur calcium-binding domain-containing protein
MTARAPGHEVPVGIRRPHRLDPRFPTCAAAKATGHGPYVHGKNPEYSWYRDDNGDGTVCE